MPSLCNKSIPARTQVAKGPFNDPNLNVISSKRRIEQKSQSWKVCIYFSN